MILNNLFYAVINWMNRPSTSTPLGQTNLNHMDKGIMQCAQYIVALSQDKAENSTVNQLVKSISVDADTGVITVTQQNGSVTQYDLDIEKVVVNFDINDQNQLVLTLDDGTQKIVDLTRFVYSANSSATVSMQMTDRTITASIIDGSVTLDKLDAAIQSTFLQYKLDAQAAKEEARVFSRDSERWAVGNETDYVGSSRDNSRYYSEQSKTEADRSSSEADRAAQYANIVAPGFYMDPETMTLYMKAGVGVDFDVFDENVLYWKIA